MVPLAKIERRILVAGGWDDDLFIYPLPRATTSIPRLHSFHQPDMLR